MRITGFGKFRFLYLFLMACGFTVIFSGICTAHNGLYSRDTPVVEAVKKVSNAVVNISSQYEVENRSNPFFNYSMDPFFKDFFDRGYERKQKLTSLGSGVIIDGARGLILTNEHVVVKTGTITVVLNDGREFKANIVGTDPETDLAVLEIDSPKKLPAIEMGDSSDIMIGETVIAIGNPFGFSNTVTTGVVSAINRSVRTDGKEYRDFIQTDASINPGNSGGPLLNINGELIGINTAIYAKAEGIGFAIPIDKAKKIISDLITYGEVVHAWIGLTVQDIDQHMANYLNLPANHGVVVKYVAPDSPAAKADIAEGDILTRVEKSDIGSVSDYELMMRSIPKDKQITLTLLRGDQTLHETVRTSVFPEKLALPLAYRLLGVKVVDMNEKGRFGHRVTAPSGVIIKALDKNSQLADINARPGDVIRRINEFTIKNTEDFKKAIIKNRWKASVVILLQRGDRGYFITLQLR